MSRNTNTICVDGVCRIRDNIYYLFTIGTCHHCKQIKAKYDRMIKGGVIKVVDLHHILSSSREMKIFNDANSGGIVPVLVLTDMSGRILRVGIGNQQIDKILSSR